MKLRKFLKNINNEKGAVLAIALLIMLALALIGLAALFTSTMELDIARNERLAKESFYLADGGTTIPPVIIEESINNRDLPDLHGITLNDTHFMNELLGSPTNNDQDTDSPDNNPDITTTINGKNIAIDVDRIGAQMLAGGAVEFASGYEGIGSGAASGGMAIFYRIESQGNAGSSSKSVVETYYRKVINITKE